MEGYIFLRLILGLIVLALATFGILRSPVADWQLSFSISAATFLVMGSSAALVRRYGETTWFLWSQMVVDTVFATGLISLSSGPQSTYFILYFMSIIAAARLLPSLGVVFVAGMDVVVYTGVSIAGLLGYLNWDLSQDILLLYSQVLLRVFGLLLVGFLSVGLVSRKDLITQIQRTKLLVKAHSELLDRLQIAVLSARHGLIVSQNAATMALLGQCVGEEVSAVFSGHGLRWEQPAPGDETRWLSCRLHPMDGGGEVIIVEDITPLRALEAQMEREERLAAVGRLAASLAHEIRNPLASLSGAVQLLEERAANPLHRIVLREVERLNGLVEDFLQSSRPLTLQRVLTDPGAVITEVLTAFGNDPRCLARDVRSRQGRTVQISLDPDRFRQVIWNLLINAAQATGEGGHIEIFAGVEEAGFVVRVSDDGQGIPQDKLLRIFDPFYTTRSGGTGLGLANVDRIIRAHGGSISAESEAGRGATFTLTLPLPTKSPEQEPDEDGR